MVDARTVGSTEDQSSFAEFKYGAIQLRLLWRQIFALTFIAKLDALLSTVSAGSGASDSPCSHTAQYRDAHPMPLRYTTRPLEHS